MQYSKSEKEENIQYVENLMNKRIWTSLELVLPPESKNDSIGKVLSRVTEYLEHYQIDSDENHKQKLIAITKQFNKNCSIIGELVSKFRTAKIKIDDLEEKHKQDLEEIYNSISEVTPDDEKSMQMMAGLSAPKSLYDRICEAADRCKKHWKLQTMENDYYCFFTLFGALPFRVHVHPNLGLVYEVKTYTNLDVIISADSRPVAWYGLKLFQHKLKEDNLLSVLGVKYDILTLLDYVNMTMEEIKNFRQEYISLVKKYGTSHHFRMNKDLSISFEVMNVNLIIHWVFTINMSPTEPISKDSIKVCCRVGEKVNEDDIKCIAENTPKGTKFIRNFIENVDDYMKRIEKKLKFKRGPY
ncbi:hypothetical protein NQ317_003005 [Molorchus minor]|uniref:Uncharacterized protein n=1 Tax=Molorchus minor TaxID=1323400 RepID=A0ABQ9JLU9_9CUCU|nr:hypothetical protein NQ317_003005 [Molorchus minor]